MIAFCVFDKSDILICICLREATAKKRCETNSQLYYTNELVIES